MIAKRLTTSLMAASALGLCAGAAHATVFTLSATGSGGVFSTPNRYDVSLANFDSNPDIFAGDEIQLTFTITDGPITLPAATGLQIFSFYLSGAGFPTGDSQTHGTMTFFDDLTQVAQDGRLTTTSDGIAFNSVFFGPTGALTFDSVTADIFVDKIGVDHATGIAPVGVNGTLENGSFSAESRSAVAAVPEPASWALMLVGFGGLGAALRRRRAQPAPA